MIRRARVDDADSIAKLLSQLGYPEATREDVRRRLERLCARDDHAIFVAEGDGLIHVGLTETLEHEPRAVILALVVEESRRSAGLGAELVARAEQWARNRGLSEMRVRSNVRRERARTFYERLGYSVTKAQNILDKTL